jgi:hypothetical protein
MHFFYFTRGEHDSIIESLYYTLNLIDLTPLIVCPTNIYQIDLDTLGKREDIVCYSFGSTS